jgi:hypothetical protein
MQSKCSKAKFSTQQISNTLQRNALHGIQLYAAAGADV